MNAVGKMKLTDLFSTKICSI